MDYLNNKSSDKYYDKWKDFIAMNLRPELSQWSTVIGVLESMDKLYEEAQMNGNFNEYYEYKYL